MNINKQTFLQLIASLLIFMWVYAAVSKLMTFELFRVQLYRQAIPHWLAGLSAWLLPFAELTVGGLLVSEKARKAGFILSAVLLFIFSIYIGLILAGVFAKVPCSCGGVIRGLGWKLHLVFNLFFLLLSCLGIYLANRERRLKE